MARAGRPPGSLQVRKAIDAGTIPPVWLWSGPEQFLKEELFRRLAEALVEPAMASLNVNRYRAGQDDLETILGSCATLPMLSERRAVLIDDIEALGRGDRDRLAAYVERPCPETALVLCGERGPRDSFHSRLAKAGAEQAVFWVPFENDTRKWVQIRFRDLGKTCDPAVALALIERCGGGHGRQVPLRDIAPEIEKVALGVGERAAIEPDDLEVICRKADEDLIYGIAGCVLKGDLPGALRALDGALLFKDNSSIRIVVTLTQRFTALGLVQDLMRSGLSGGEVQRAAGVWERDWAETERAARRIPPRALRRGLNALALADRTLKSSPKDPRVVLEETLAALCARGA